MDVSRRPSSGAIRAVLGARGRPPPRVVVAEDDAEMRRIIVQALRQDGYEVEEAVDGGRLITRVTAPYLHPNETLDLIISDIRMPMCSGIEILEALRTAHWTVPVILMTAFGDDETRARAKELGALLFDKPFAIQDLRTTVHDLVPILGRDPKGPAST